MKTPEKETDTTLKSQSEEPKPKKPNANWRKLPRPRKRRLTSKQAKYVTALLEGATTIDAVREAGYTAKQPHCINYQNLHNENVLSVIIQSIKEGRYDKQFEKVWDDCLNDEGNQSVKVSERMDTHRTKLKAVEQIAKIGGLIAPVKHETRTLTADITSLLPKGSIAK